MGISITDIHAKLDVRHDRRADPSASADTC